MNILLAYFILSLAQLSIYFYLKNNIKNLQFFDYSDYSSPLENEVIEKSNTIPQKNSVADKFTNNIEEHKLTLLNKSLKHLEFISEFEMYLEDKNYKNFPIEFLQEFEKIKIEAQLSALKSTSQLTNSIQLAA